MRLNNNCHLFARYIIIAVIAMPCIFPKLAAASDWIKYYKTENNSYSGEIDIDGVTIPENGVYEYSMRRGNSDSIRIFRANCNNHKIQRINYQNGVAKIDYQDDAVEGDYKEQWGFVCGGELKYLLRKKELNSNKKQLNDPDSRNYIYVGNDGGVSNYADIAGLKINGTNLHYALHIKLKTLSTKPYALVDINCSDRTRFEDVEISLGKKITPDTAKKMEKVGDGTQVAVELDTMCKYAFGENYAILVPSDSTAATKSKSSGTKNSENVSSRSAFSTPTSILFDDDPRIKCESKFQADDSYSVIASKVSLTGPAGITFQMLADQSRPSANEKVALAALVDASRKCSRESEAYRKQTYPTKMNAILEKVDEEMLNAYISAYNNKMSFGMLNATLQKIDKKYKKELDSISQQIQAQHAEREAQQRQERARQAEQEEANRARAAALRDAQQRQEQAIQEQQRQQALARQAERDRVATVRRQWESRCSFDRENAFIQARQREQEKCDNAAKSAQNSIGFLVTMGCLTQIEGKAQNYAKIAFDACMSGAPN